MPDLFGVLGLRPPRARTGGAAPRPNPADAASIDTAIPSTALAGWRTERQAVVAQLRGLAARAAKSQHARARDAFIEIQGVVSNLARDPLTLRQVDELERWLREDDIVGDIDDLVGALRTPLLAALATARASVQG